VVTLPPSVKEIGVSAFAYSGLEKIIFKKGSELETIGESAFYNCIELKVVTLTPNVKEIGASAFSCSSLEKVIFKEGSKLETIGERAFRGNENLKTITIPLGVVIEERAFENTGCPEDIFTQGATIVDCIVSVRQADVVF